MICKKSKILGGLLALSTPFFLFYMTAGPYAMSPVAMAVASDSSSFAAIEAERGLPVRGMSSGAVIEKFGEPESRSSPVGHPPISMWQYDTFKVYFEYKLVITTVAEDDRLPEKLKEIQ